MTVCIEKNGPVSTIINDRINARNAGDPETADALTATFLAFDLDPESKFAVFWGAGGAFCASWDLKYAADGQSGISPSTAAIPPCLVESCQTASGPKVVGSLGERCRACLVYLPAGRPRAFVRTGLLKCEPALTRFSRKKVTYSDFRSENWRRIRGPKRLDLRP